MQMPKIISSRMKVCPRCPSGRVIVNRIIIYPSISLLGSIRRYHAFLNRSCRVDQLLISSRLFLRATIDAQFFLMDDDHQHLPTRVPFACLYETAYLFFPPSPTARCDNRSSLCHSLPLLMDIYGLLRSVEHEWLRKPLARDISWSKHSIMEYPGCILSSELKLLVMVILDDRRCVDLSKGF